MDDGYKTAKFENDHSRGTFLKITRTMERGNRE
jgi:hypothetical protein